MPQGEAVQILMPTEDWGFELNRAALERILLQKHIQNKNVVVISVAGILGIGKSFILSFFLRYLNAEGAEDWMGELDEPLTGFKWKASQDRITRGIFMWSKPFQIRLPTGEEVVILLMYTQETYDGKSMEEDNSIIFALSAMLSSVLIYNVSENLYENDLLHLQLFAEYWKLALDSITVPFQKLIFLVRDYPLADEWGTAGGRTLLKERMQVENKELQIVREMINSSFTDFSCYLMPYPGIAVASKVDFNGRLVDINNDFRYYLRKFISDLLKPSSLVVKNINGNNVTAKNFIQYFSSYMEIFSSDALSTPQNILQGVIECENIIALINMKELYTKKMGRLTESICASDEIVDEEQKRKLKESHAEIKTEVLSTFDSIKKTGGYKDSKKYRDELILYLDDQYFHLLKLLKNMKALRTSVDQIEVMFRRRMDELYGINAPCKDEADIDRTYVMLVGESIHNFYATPESLVRVKDLTPVYREKLDRVMEGILKFYNELNSEKITMTNMVNKILQEFENQMKMKFELSDPVIQAEFLKTHMPIRSEVLKLFDQGKCSQQITAVFKDRLEREMQFIVNTYDNTNRQKLQCECLIGEYKDKWNGNKEESMHKAKQQFKSMVENNPLLQTYFTKLEEKLNKRWAYEEFVAPAKLVYNKCMRGIITAESGKVTEEEADRQHACSKSKAIDSLTDDIKKMGEDEEHVGYTKQLDDELDYLYLCLKGTKDDKGKGCIIL